MPTPEITINDNGLSNRLRQPIDFVRTMARAGLQLKRTLERIAPKRTGKLAASFAIQVEDQGKRLAITNTVRYHRYVNDGTRYMTGRKYMERGLEMERAGIEREFETLMRNEASRIEGR